MRATMGWCYTCAKPTVVERFFDVFEVRELQEKILRARTRLADEALNASAKSNWWQREQRATDAITLLETEIENATNTLRRLRHLAAIFNERIAGPHCIECFSEDWTPLPPSSIDAEYCPESASPVKLGFQHPGCGGEITVENDVRFFMKWKPQYFDFEGFPLNTPVTKEQ
ncbi:hypothetical protein [Caballeronia telluris]|nr:hypothetical protein [Caballeronia telluris]